jgi:hypothetical protein
VRIALVDEVFSGAQPCAMIRVGKSCKGPVNVLLYSSYLSRLSPVELDIAVPSEQFCLAGSRLPSHLSRSTVKTFWSESLSHLFELGSADKRRNKHLKATGSCEDDENPKFAFDYSQN